MPKKRLTNEQRRYDPHIVVDLVVDMSTAGASWAPHVGAKATLFATGTMAIFEVQWTKTSFEAKKCLQNAKRPKWYFSYFQRMHRDISWTMTWIVQTLDFFPQGSQLVIFYAQKLLELCVLIWTWSWEDANSIDSASAMFQFLVFAKAFYVFYMMFHCFTMSYCTFWKLPQWLIFSNPKQSVFASGKLCSAPSEAHPSEDSLGKMWTKKNIHIFLILGEYILPVYLVESLSFNITMDNKPEVSGGPFAEPFSKHFDIPCGFGLQLLGSRYIRDFLWHWGKTTLNQPHHDFA